jgi:hypothetical protein
MDESMTGARKAGAALMLSAIFPGLGQFYNRQPGKGAAFFILGLIFGWISAEKLPPLNALLAGNVPEGAGKLVIVLWLFLALYTWSMVDAYRAAWRTARR